MKGAGFLILSVCLLMFSSAPFAETSHVGANVEAFNFRFVGTESVTVVVPDDFLTIQEAINNAVEGDTIFVKSGIYYEHVVVNKTVSLVGEDSCTTIIDGNWTGVVVNVTRDGVVVSDLTVQRSGSIYWRNAGILLDNVEACRISENILTQNSFAGLELNYSRHCGILGNLIISNGGVGITLVGGNSNDLSRNNITKNGWSAITLNDEADCNTISENSMTSNNQAVTGHCINLYRSSNNSIQKNRITGDDNGIRLEYSSRFNTISQNTIINNDGNGIEINFSSNNNMLSENIITENGYYGVGLHLSRGNIFIRNNITDNDYSGIGLHYSPGSAIVGNRVLENNYSGVWLDSSSGSSIVGNYIIGNIPAGVSVERNSNNNTVSGNTITGGRFGVVVNGSRYADIYNNTIAHNHGPDEWDAGVRLESAGYAQIHDNEITDNHYGILLYSNSPRVSVYANTVTENYVGIRVASGGSSYLNATENVIANSTASGIGITGWGSVSNYATISRNLIANNYDGILLGRYSNYNTIFQNSISQNGFGFYIEYSAQNTIFGNNFLGNHQQVNMYTSSVNTWDGGYPAGGNYWSDYAGVDVKSCPNQDVPGRDGIGDIPYVIDAINRDSYPLMTPYTTPTGIRDVAVLKVTACVNVTWKGSSVDINVTVRNKGDYADNRTVTVYCDSDLIGTQTVTLVSGENVTLSFSWDTTGAAPGNHTLKAVASMVLAEANITDNVLVDGTVRIRMFGDLNGDNKTDIKDIGLAALAFGSYAYPVVSPRWNPDADMNVDGGVDIRDLALIAKHFGEIYP